VRTLFPALLAVAVGLTGCVDRQFVIKTNPAGAVVFANNVPLSGATPAEKQFEFYGIWNFTIVKDGYQTLQVSQPIPRPWYQYFPFDFVAENMLPFTIRDVRVFEYNLMPEMVLAPERLIEQATPVRQRGQMLAPLAPTEQAPQPAPVPVVPQQPPPPQ
jgi:hypothetical protein